MITLSYIVPVYNVELYLKECIESLYLQGISDEEFEVIAINDGSTDKSAEILKALGDKHANMTIISQTNKGLSSSRNVGINKAQGEYILFVDSDDIIVPHTMIHLVEMAKDKRPDIIRGSYVKFHTEPDKKQLLKRTTNKPKYTEANGEKCFLEHYEPNSCYSWLNLYKRVFLIRERLYFPEGMYFEDIVHTTKAYLLAQSLIETEMKFYLYRQQPTSILANISERKILDLVKAASILNQYKPLTKDNEECGVKLENAVFSTINKALWYVTHYNSLRHSISIVIKEIHLNFPKFFFKNTYKQLVISLIFHIAPKLYLFCAQHMVRKKY